MEEDTVEHCPRGGLEAERDVREPQDRPAPGKALGDQLDPIERLKTEPAVVVVAGGDREGQRIEEEVFLGQFPTTGVERVDPLGDLKLARGRLGHACLRILVDRERHARRAVAAQHRADACHALLAVLEVDRVDDAPTAGALQARLEHVGIGRIEHERRIDLPHVAAHDLAHVAHAIAAHEVHAQVEHLAAVADFLAGHAHEAIPVLLVDQALELAAAVGVRALGDDQERVLLLEFGVAVEAAAAGRLWFLGRTHRLAVLERGRERSDVLGGGAAAAAERIHAVLLHEASHRLDESRWLQRIDGLAVLQDGQPGIGHHAHATVPVLGQVRHVRRHLDRAGRAVQAEALDREWPQGIDDRGDLGAQQHGAGRLHRHAHEDRAVLHAAARRVERIETRVDRALHLQQVLAGLDHEAVDAAIEKPPSLLAVARQHEVPRRLAERDELRPRPNRPGHEPRAVRRCMAIAGRSRDARSLLVERMHPTDHLLVELRGDQPVGAEGVGLDDVGTSGQHGLVDPLDQVGTAAHQDVRAVVASEPILGAAVLAGVDRGSHRTVEQHGATVHDTQKAAGHAPKVVLPRRSFNRSPGWTDGAWHHRRPARRRLHLTALHFAPP